MDSRMMAKKGPQVDRFGWESDDFTFVEEPPKKPQQKKEKAPVRKANDGESAEAIALAELQNTVVELAEKKKGPGKGWWGPAHGGTHKPREGREKPGKLTTRQGQNLSSKERKAIAGEIEETWSGDRKLVALDAMKAMSREGMAASRMDGLVLYAGKEVVGVAAVSYGQTSSSLRGSCVEVWELATKRPGVGRETMKQVAKQARTRNLGVVLLSVSPAKGFYRKLGMRQQGENIFWLSAEDVQQGVL